MNHRPFPMIDPVKTGKNILRLRKERGLTVRDIQIWFNFEEPRAIYKWQTGQTLPSVDNLYALSILLEVPMDSLIIGTGTVQEPQNEPAAHHLFLGPSIIQKTARPHMTARFIQRRRSFLVTAPALPVLPLCAAAA